MYGDDAVTVCARMCVAVAVVEAIRLKYVWGKDLHINAPCTCDSPQDTRARAHTHTHTHTHKRLAYKVRTHGREPMQRGGGLLSACFGPCLVNVIATTWVDFFNATVLSRRALEEENEIIRMGAVHRDLDATYQRLLSREAELDAKADFLANQAVAARRQGKMELAKRKMVERARVISNADKIRNSARLIDMHRSTIEDANLDVEVLQTLKASNAALKEKGVCAEGVHAVDSIIMDAQSNLQSASEITGALSSSFADAVSTVLVRGDLVGEHELMQELEEMLMSEDASGGGRQLQNFQQQQQQQHSHHREGGWGTLRAGEEMAGIGHLYELPSPPQPASAAQGPDVVARRTLRPPPLPSDEKEEKEDDASGAYAPSAFLSVPLQSARRKMVVG
jgi:hypothetical protein